MQISCQSGDDGNESLFGFAFVLGWLGDVEHLGQGASTRLVDLGYLELAGKEFKQGFLIFEFGEIGHIVGIPGRSGGFVSFLFGQLSAQVGPLDQGLLKVSGGLGQIP